MCSSCYIHGHWSDKINFYLYIAVFPKSVAHVPAGGMWKNITATRHDARPTHFDIINHLATNYLNIR